MRMYTYICTRKDSKVEVGFTVYRLLTGRFHRRNRGIETSNTLYRHTLQCKAHIVISTSSFISQIMHTSSFIDKRAFDIEESNARNKGH
jgi:hypothetical protein